MKTNKIMKTVATRFAVVFSILATITFIGFAIMGGDLNPMQWSEDTRSTFGGWFIFFGVASLAMSGVSVIEHKDDDDDYTY